MGELSGRNGGLAGPLHCDQLDRAIDSGDVSDTLPSKCKKTELLFIHLFLRLLDMGGRLLALAVDTARPRPKEAPNPGGRIEWGAVSSPGAAP